MIIVIVMIKIMIITVIENDQLVLLESNNLSQFNN